MSAGFLRSELIGYYPFEVTDHPMCDLSGHGNNITGSAGTNPQWSATAGFLGTGAYRFVDDRLLVPIDINPSEMPQMTWGAWVRTDTLTSHLRKIMGHDNGGWDRAIGLDFRTGGLRYTSFTGVGRPVVGTPRPRSVQDWTFFAASYDQEAEQVTVYVDLDASTTDDDLVVVQERAFFGSGWNTFSIGSIRPDSSSEAWRGVIDNVFIYDEVLPAAEVRKLRDSFGVPQSPTVDDFRALPGYISSGESTVLSWDVSLADEVSIAGVVIPEGASSVEVSPTSTTVYTLTATNDQGSVTEKMTVGVDVSPLPPLITEFVAMSDGTFLDGNDNDSDWLEIHNPNPYALDLEGFQLQDSNRTWTFPATYLGGDCYLVLFASSREEPDYVDPAGYLHTTFAISSSGEDLRLLTPEGKVVIEYTDLPSQPAGISYGLAHGSDRAGFLNPPTPGERNGPSSVGEVADTKFDVHRGLYTDPFEVVISSATPGASISYTTDGSEPSTNHGTIVRPMTANTPGSARVRISTTTTLRAIAFREGGLPSNVDTHTYIFPAHVMNQGPRPTGFPTSWGVFTGVNGGSAGSPVPADYEMKRAIVSADRFGMDEALRSLPIISIVADRDDLFSREGILSNPFGSVDGSGVFTHNPYQANRRCSMEWIDPEGGRETQVDCGIRLAGGWSRHYRATPKKSFHLLFRREFGVAKLRFPVFGEGEVDEFDRLALKGIFSNGWVDAAVRPDYLRDLMLRETQRAMGQPASRGTWVHLYLNGLYWGIYNPTERCDANWAASHFEGGESDFDAIKHAGLCAPGCAVGNQFEVIDGDGAAWQRALQIADLNLAVTSNWNNFKQYVDVTNLADYIILNSWCANVDWPGKNWYAFRRRAPGAGYKFISWDAEYALENVSANRVNVGGSNTPARLYERARGNAEFRLLFADRVYKHCFNGGALDPNIMRARYRRLSEVIEPAIDAEAARWGDNPNTRQGNRDYRKSHWLAARNHILSSFLPNRRSVVMSQYRAAGLYPSVDPPTFNRHGGSIPAGTSITLTSPRAGTIYYTMDGEDPIFRGRPTRGALIYRSAFELTESATVKARIRISGGELSALTEATFTVDAENASSENLVISKIHYNPSAPSEEEVAAGFDRRRDFEYLELLNHGSRTISLAGLSFVNGITFSFANDSLAELEPGQRGLLVENATAFALRYGERHLVLGEFERDNLNDDGEELALVDRTGADLWRFRYNDGGAWPDSPDGDGPALVLLSPLSPPSNEAMSLPGSWRPSREAGGSPGTSDGIDFATWLADQAEPDPLADPNGDGINQLLSFAIGAGENEFAVSSLPSVILDSFDDPDLPGDYAIIAIRERIGASGLSSTIEQSVDLQNWSPADVVLLSSTDQGDGSMMRRYRTREPIAPAVESDFYLRHAVVVE